MLTKDEQAEIMRQDRRRRRQREQAEAIEQWLLQHAPAESAPAMPNLRGIGIVGKPPVSKASRDNWTTGRNARSRTVGMAPGAYPRTGQHTSRHTRTARRQSCRYPPASAPRLAELPRLRPDLAERNAAARERLAATLAAHPIGNVE